MPGCAAQYILSYSPIDNIRRSTFPNVLFTAGLNDPRVAYWEPAKFIAKLREHSVPEEGAKEPREALLKTDMSSGHFSSSDRYKYREDKAFQYAWLLKHIAPKTIEIDA